MSCIRRIKCFSYIPISPTFDMELKLWKCKRSADNDESETMKSQELTSSVEKIETDFEMKPSETHFDNVAAVKD